MNRRRTLFEGFVDALIFRVILLLLPLWKEGLILRPLTRRVEEALADLLAPSDVEVEEVRISRTSLAGSPTIALRGLRAAGSGRQPWLELPEVELECAAAHLLAGRAADLGITATGGRIDFVGAEAAVDSGDREAGPPLGTVIARATFSGLTIGPEREGTPSLLLDGEAERAADGTLEATACIRAGEIPLSSFARVWPSDVAPEVRDWILEAIPSGDVRDLDLRVGLAAGEEGIATRTLSGAFVFEDLTIDFLGPGGAFSGVRGAAFLDTSTFDFRIDGARIGAIDIGAGSVSFTTPLGDRSRAEIRLESGADIPTALAFLSSPPIDLSLSPALHPNRVAGDVTAQVTIAFDFDALPDFSTRVEATATGVAASGFAAGLDMTSSTLKIEANDSLVEITGPVAVNGIPGDLSTVFAIGETEPHRRVLLRSATEAGGFSLEYEEGADGAHIELRAGDLGLLLNRTETTSRFAGGRLVLTAVRAPSVDTFAGSLKCDDLRILRAPLLARLLASASLNGLRRALSEDGIPFREIRSSIEFGGREALFQDIRCSGPSLGISGRASLDFRSGRVRAAGLLAPMSEVQKMVAGLPVVGALLAGPSGRDLVAIEFSLRGPWNRPDIRIHPVPQVTPDIARMLKELLLDPLIKT